MERILRLENRRVACDSLLVFFGHSDGEVRARAVEALGRLQDTDCLRAVADRLYDPETAVREKAAFALGQLGDPDAERAIHKHLRRETSVSVQKRLVEALGKIGTEKSFPVILKFFSSRNRDLQAEGVLAAARMARRNLKSAAITDSLTTLLKNPDSGVRYKACYALMRIVEGVDFTPLLEATYDDDPRVRMFAVRALGALQDTRYLDRLGYLLRRDADWRVRVNAANALGNYPLTLVGSYLTLLDANHHVRRAVARAIGESVQQGEGRLRENSREFLFAKNQLQEILTDTTTNGRSLGEQGTALVALAKLAGSSALGFVASFTEHPTPRLRAYAMEALGETRSRRAYPYLRDHFQGAQPIVKIAILQALGKIDDPRKGELYLQALREGDAVQVALAAQALSQEELRGDFSVQPILQAHDRLPKPVEMEAAQMIFEALAKFGDPRAVPALERALEVPNRAYSGAAARALAQITGEDYSDRVARFTEPHHHFTYEEIQGLRGSEAHIRTRRGSIKIELLAGAAPITVLNFLRLAEQAFYDSLSFHRVVPNFVIQGGDPRGDLWGSPGYTIRSEFNEQAYVRGIVGMASAGKDTEGCQFFITHSPQHHLDGRYTAFGRVTDGLNVVDAIQEGDTIFTVEIRR